MASHDLPAVYFPPEVAQVERAVEGELPLRQQLEQRMEQLMQAAREQFGTEDFTTREVEYIARDLLIEYDWAQENGRGVEYSLPGSFVRLTSDPNGGNAAETAQHFIFGQLVQTDVPSIEMSPDWLRRGTHRHYYATNLPGRFFIEDTWTDGDYVGASPIRIHTLRIIENLGSPKEAYRLAGPVQK